MNLLICESSTAAPALQTFGPRLSNVMRQQMVCWSNCRSCVNNRVIRIKLMFIWGLGNRLIHRVTRVLYL